MPTKAELLGLKPVLIEQAEEPKPLTPVFDLERINMVQLADDLSALLNRPAPKTWIGQWFRSKSISLDTERVQKVAEYVENVRIINQKITNLQAELMLAPSVLESLITGHFVEAKMAAELQVRQHQEALQSLDDQAEARKIQLKKAKAEARKDEAIAAIIESGLDNPDAIKALLIIKALDPKADAQIDSAFNTFLEQKAKKEELEIENLKLDNQLKSEDVKSRRAKADTDKAKADKSISEIKKVFEE